MLANISFTESFLHLNKKKKTWYINKKEKQKTPVGTVQALTLKKQIHVHDCSLSWLGTGT
jgi:hypothetical protein